MNMGTKRTLVKRAYCLKEQFSSTFSLVIHLAQEAHSIYVLDNFCSPTVPMSWSNGGFIRATFSAMS